MTDKGPALPLYYAGKSLADMEALLRANYLTKSGWLESAEHRLPLRRGEPQPWFTFPAIEFLERQVSQDLSVFEYGSGNSTLWWGQRVARVSSVDHDEAFVRFLAPRLPAHARLKWAPEGAPVPPSMESLASQRPRLVDPPKDLPGVRSQLNEAYLAYALSLLEPGEAQHDIVVIDGMARIHATWAAIRHFSRRGFIVFDNSDREAYRPAYDLLDGAGYRRLDFWGMGPINPYEWCTSVFYQPTHFLASRWFPSKQPHPVAGEDTTAILVIGFSRPQHLQSVLESLRLQGRVAVTRAS